jgi:hypothetical protein
MELEMGAVVCLNLDADQEILRNVVENQKSWHGDSFVSRELDCDDFFCLAAEKPCLPIVRRAQPAHTFRNEFTNKATNKEGNSALKEIHSSKTHLCPQSIDTDSVNERKEHLRVCSPDISKCKQDSGGLKLKSLKPLPIKIQIL